MRHLIFALFFAAPAAALAQEEAREGDTIIYQQKTVVSFDGDTIDGDLTRPDGEFIESRKRIRHSNLIKIRDNFRMRILRSVSEL
ncbi:MAG: adventurous gliding motility protein CglF [Myxococcota bacterium]